MLSIRLQRTGKKGQPYYRLVVTEHTNPVQGKFLATVGNYNPRTHELNLDKEEVSAWLNKGVRPSNTVAKLFKKSGLDHKLVVVEEKHKAPKKKGDEKPTAAPAPAVTEVPEAAPEAGTEVAEPMETTDATEANSDDKSTETLAEGPAPEAKTK